MGSGPIVVSWHRFGPYHLARLDAAGDLLNVVGLEISTVDKVNLWEAIEGRRALKRTLFVGEDPDKLAVDAVARRLWAGLDEIGPSAVAVHGWADRYALLLLTWAQRRGVPTVLMSESTVFDDRRYWYRELGKRQIVSLFDAGLVGGEPQRFYLERLGMPRGQIAFGYDVVDNRHFADGAALARQATLSTMSRSRLRSPYFLASARFVAKKNLSGLIEAYARYRREAQAPWQLVILGDGELRPELEAQRAALRLEDDVLLPGFKQYDELPSWYGAAGCFVHASTSEQWGLVVNEAMASGLPVLVSDRCGCAVDLVQEGRNGFCFDPLDAQKLAGLLDRMSRASTDRVAMGEASRVLISPWGPERFAQGLKIAVERAASAGQRRKSWVAEALLGLLARR